MIKEKKILLNYCLYILTGLLICIVGISDCFALTYDNVGYLDSVTTLMVAPDYTDTPITVPIDTALALAQVTETIVFVDNYNFSANTNYQLELHINRQQFTNVNYYSVQGANGENCLVSYSNSNMNGQYPKYAFQCSTATNQIVLSLKNSNGSYLWPGSVNNAPQWSWDYAYLRRSSTSIGGQDTDAIINNNNQNTQTIINNFNNNTQNIIDNQNNNTDKIIEENNKNFQTCTVDKNFFNYKKYNKAYGFTNDGGTLTVNAIVNNSSDRGFYIKLEPNSTYTISISKLNTGSDKIFTLFDDQPITSGMVGISRQRFATNTSSINTTITTDSTHIYLFAKIYNVNYTSPYTLDEILKSISIIGPHCSNKLDDTTDAIDNLNDTLKDDDIDSSNTTDTLDDLNSSLPTNSVVSDLLLLPVRLLQAIVNSLGTTCSNFNLGSLYGTNLIMPCINIQNYVGSAIWTFIDLVFSGTFILVIRKKFIQIFENITNLRNGGNEVD